jgi:rhamnose transport system permease protein
LLNTILAALYVVGVSPFWTQAIAGALILVAISIDRLISLQLTSALRRRRARAAV